MPLLFLLLAPPFSSTSSSKHQESNKVERVVFVRCFPSMKDLIVQRQESRERFWWQKIPHLERPLRDGGVKNFQVPDLFVALCEG